MQARNDKLQRESIALHARFEWETERSAAELSSLRRQLLVERGKSKAAEDDATLALELAKENRTYESLATKFFQHYIYVGAAMKRMGGRNYNLWDEEDAALPWSISIISAGEFENIVSKWIYIYIGRGASTCLVAL